MLFLNRAGCGLFQRPLLPKPPTEERGAHAFPDGSGVRTKAPACKVLIMEATGDGKGN
jgi:hypothetical protein